MQFPDGPKMPRKVVADLVLRCDDADRIIDVTICDPSAKSYLLDSFASHRNVGAVAEARSASKFASYAHRIPEIVGADHYVTFAMEVTGHLCDEAQGLLTGYIRGPEVKQGRSIRNQLTRLMWKWNAKKILNGRKLLNESNQPTNNILINKPDADTHKSNKAEIHVPSCLTGLSCRLKNTNRSPNSIERQLSRKQLL